MSFAEYHECIRKNDVVILHIGFNNMLAITIDPGKVLQTKYGVLRHNDLVGVRYGSKVQCPKGWLHVLYPTPELWTLTLPHRTQILYTPDISLIVFHLELKPGSVVVESGTGSGSLSHALIRSVMPTGHLHTFEFHQERATKARNEFAQHDLAPYVTVTHRDVCAAPGFDLTGVADAVFLDLPQPWLAIDSATAALKREGGRICSFSPCIEQVQRTCLKLQECGFEDIDTVECVQRSLDVRKITMPLADLGEGKADNVMDSNMTSHVSSIASSNVSSHASSHVSNDASKSNRSDETIKRAKVDVGVAENEGACSTSVCSTPISGDGENMSVGGDQNKSVDEDGTNKPVGGNGEIVSMGEGGKSVSVEKDKSVSVGETGKSGSVGETGKSVSVGETGKSVSVGETGKSGSVGETGKSVSVGETGKSVSVGETGKSGSLGETGKSGSVGETGKSGSVGETGKSGSVGETGKSGSVGETGKSGPVGETGKSGPVGETGKSGEDGKTTADNNSGNQSVLKESLVEGVKMDTVVESVDLGNDGSNNTVSKKTTNEDDANLANDTKESIPRESSNKQNVSETVETYNPKQSPNSSKQTLQRHGDTSRYKFREKKTQNNSVFKSSVPSTASMLGHTGYLTFATLYDRDM